MFRSRFSPILLIAALLAAAPLALRFARAQTAPSITAGPTVSAITDRTVTITWSTSVESSSIVQYGTTSSLGQEQRNIVFLGPGEDEDEARFSHSVTLQELTQGTTYFFRVKSDTNLSTVNDDPAAVSATSTFTTASSTPSCTADTWECSAYGTCGTDGKQVRTCTLKTDCQGVETPKPAESQSCTPACTADVWECTAYGTCRADGKQTRTCTLKTDCATDTTTVKPADSQSCTPACTKDEYSCTEWSACRDSVQTRTCTLKTDCATDTTTAKPAEKQACTSCTKDEYSCSEWSVCKDGAQLRTCTLKTDCATDTTTAKPAEKQACTSCTKDEWSCTDWGTCVGLTTGSGSQTRTCTLKSDCATDTTTTRPVEKQSCTASSSCTEDTWTCGAWGECKTLPTGNSQSRTCVLTDDCADVDTKKPVETQACTPDLSCKEDTYKCEDWGKCERQPTGAWAQNRICKLETDCPAVTTDPQTKRNCYCTEDTYDCSGWSACKRESDGRDYRTRDCKMTADCSAVTTAKPSVKENCSCTEDTWTCGDWAQCDKDSRSQARKCSLTFDCPFAETAKPADMQRCEPCVADFWQCSDWSACQEGKQARRCQLAFDCPYAEDPEPRLEAECEEPEPSIEIAASIVTSVPEDQVSEELNQRILNWTAVRSTVQDFEKNTENVSGGFGLIGASGNTQEKLVTECKDGEVDLDRCDEWLETKYADKRCEERGLFTKSSCETFLAQVNGGIFPGCEGKTASECDEIKDRATLGYLTDEWKEKTDEVVDQAIKDHVMVLLPDVTSVNDKLAGSVKWYPSAKNDDQETSAGVIVLDLDKDGLPDAVEAKLGLDPSDADSDDDGVPDGKVTRDILKSFFESGDKPTQAQFANLLDSMLNLSPVDHMFILGNALEQPTGEGDVDETFRVFVIPHILEKSGSLDLTGDPNQPAALDGNDPDAVRRTELGDPNDADLADNAQPANRNLVTGRALPNTTVLIYIYSYVPMVLAVQTDADGNFSYDLSDSVVDGEHTVYVAVTDETGQITKKSNPLSFFVKEALAVGEDDFLRSDVTPSIEPVAELKRYYVLGTIALVLVAAVIALGFIMGPKRKPEAKA